MANEKRLIDANALVSEFMHSPAYSACEFQRIARRIHKAPTVDAVEVVHAYWIRHAYAEEENGLLVPNYECSACHSWERDEGYYCPNCGAKMDLK